MYLTHNDLSKYIVFDIETDGLAPTRIWCAVAKNVGTKQVYRLRGHAEIKRFIDEAPADTTWVGHNCLSFDFPHCNRLLGTKAATNRIVDTLVLSYLFNPVIGGGHSLDAWGERLKFPKGEWSDFSEFSEEMLLYCERDVELTYRVFLALTKRMREIGYSEASCKLEHDIVPIINRQHRNGFFFDIERAELLHRTLRWKQAELEHSITRLFPPTLREVHTYNLRTRKDGSAFSSYARHSKKYPQITRNGGTYTVWDWQSFNIGSPKQRIDRLLALGYEPTKFTPKGAPQIDEEALIEWAKDGGPPEAQEIADWMVAFARGNMVQTWLNSVNREDSCIHGRVFSCGAGTRRMTHSGPNTANIPSNEAKYGKECRELWRARAGNVLVGYDASSAQMRMFGHYLGNPDVVEIYTGKQGDPHQRNADLAGVTRRGAKNSFYAFIFGAQDKKLGLINGGGPEVGKRVRAALYQSTPGLEDCVNNAVAEYNANDGRMKCIDGGYVLCPSPHAALCYLIQSAEGVLMKTAAVMLDRQARKAGIEHKKVGDIHDEAQHETALRASQVFGELAVQCLRDSGEHLNFKVPMDGNYKVGASWAETH